MARLILIFLACSVSVGIMMLIVATRPHGQTYSRQETSPGTANTPAQVMFRNIAILDGTTKDGAQTVNYLYKTSDCLPVSEKNISFKTQLRAHQEIENVTKAASTIIERGPKLDSNGQTVGARAVLEFSADGQQHRHTEIIWNKGSDFHSIAAPSLQYALEFETSLQAQDGRIIFPRVDAVRGVSFTPTRTSEGKTEQGFIYSEEQLRSADCETVTVRREYFDSPARAQEAMEKKLKEAIDITERGPKLDAAGQQVGLRAVAYFKAQQADQFLDQAMIIWTVKSEYHSIEGPFAHVLEFERQFYR